MTFKLALDIDCGIRHMYNALYIMSSCGRKLQLSARMMTTESEIEAYYYQLNEIYNSDCSRIAHRLMYLKDIETTIKRLADGTTLSDIELFEIKYLAILSKEIWQMLTEQSITVIQLPCLDKVISTLDPDGLNIASFYIYDSYSDELREIRKAIRHLQGNGVELTDEQRQELAILLEKNANIELAIREDLSQALCTYASDLQQALHNLSHLDVLIAKAEQMKRMHLCFPRVNTSGTTYYRGMFNPAVKEQIATQGREFMPIDINFNHTPVTIIGANMGGKSVVLRTLALNQLLTQFGFGVAAHDCNINLVEEITLCIGDEQSVSKGLSSFAAEILAIDTIIKKTREGVNILALVDEPARTTNPIEGTALVEGLLQTIDHVKGAFILTTHYNIMNDQVKRYRVKGLHNGVMDYTLQETQCGEVPHEAIAIAESMCIDSQWIENAKKNLNN